MSTPSLAEEAQNIFDWIATNRAAVDTDTLEAIALRLQGNAPKKPVVRKVKKPVTKPAVKEPVSTPVIKVDDFTSEKNNPPFRKF